MTRAQELIHAFVLKFYAQHGRFPTYHQVRSQIGYSSIRTVHHHVHALAEKGWLTIEAGRGITAARDAA